MQLPLRRFILASLAVSLAAAAGACADSARGPTSPSSVAAPIRTVAWECGRQAQSTSTDGWTFAPAAGCSATAAVADLGVGLISAAPGNLRSTIATTTVRLDWDSVPDAVSFVIEAGSAPLLADLARLASGTAASALVVNNVPSGTYFVRVRAVGTDGVPGPPSNEITVRVGAGGTCGASPLAPSGFAAAVDGSRVTLTWVAPVGGDPTASYIVEAGSAPTLRNLVVFDTGVTATRLEAQAPSGLYYTRIRGRNACGIGAGSNEVVIAIGVPLPQLPPPTPPETPGTPPSGGGTGGGGTGGGSGGGGGTTCAYSVTPTGLQFAAAGGTFDVRVSTTAGCGWTASSSAAFVAGVSGASSSGAGSARFAISANPGASARQGSVRVAFASGGGQDVNLSQVASSPTMPVGQPIETVVNVGSGLGITSTVVNMPPPVPLPNAGACVDCRPVLATPTVTIPGLSQVALQLNSANNVPFDGVIIATSAAGGAGGASYIDVDFAAATTSASLLVSVPPGTTFTAQVALTSNSQVPANYLPVTFAPPPACTYSISGPTSALSSAGGTFDVGVSTAAGCGWTASTSSTSFISVVTGSGSGTGAARFSLSPNSSTSPRSGTVEVAGQFVAINQVAAAPPSGPAVESGIQIPTQSQVVSQQLIQTRPPSPRPNSGGCSTCPVLGAPAVTLGSPASTAPRVAPQAVATTMTVRLATTNQVPFNTIIVTTGNLVGDTPEAASYYLLRLSGPTTSATVVLDVSTTNFMTQFAVTMNAEQPSNYVAAVLASGSGFSGSLAATSVQPFGTATCQYTQQFTGVAASVAISQNTVTQSEVTATGVESVLAGCSATPIPSNQHRYVLLASSILLNGTSLKVTYTQTSGQPAVSLTLEGTISGNVINGALIFRRTDNASLPWTLTVPVTLTR